MSSSLSIGFVGLGAMGWPMAARLLAKYQVVVFDIDAARAASFSEQVGGKQAQSLAELAAASDVVITMLPTSREVEAVLTGASGVLAHCRKGTLIIEMSSGAPMQTKVLAQRATEVGCSLVDAPVSGGVSRARTGELAIMIGGETAHVQLASPVLELMGSAVLETGPVGSGQAMKALNNLVSASTLLATIEAVRIGERAGLDPARMVDILNVSTGMSNSSLKKMHQFVLSRKFDSGFGLDLMVKDLNNAKSIASELDCSASLSERCIQLWSEAAETLGRGQDHTAVVKAIEARESAPARS